MRPSKEIEFIIEILVGAVVCFVYFLSRNMRYTKELASQIGINIAWNCVIFLCLLDEGQVDPQNMTSTNADWVINTRLPNGDEDVKRHLEEVYLVRIQKTHHTHFSKDNLGPRTGALPIIFICKGFVAGFFS